MTTFLNSGDLLSGDVQDLLSGDVQRPVFDISEDQWRRRNVLPLSSLDYILTYVP